MSSPIAGSQPLSDQSSARKVIAVVGVNAPGLGLVSAICEDTRGDFAVRAVLEDVASLVGRSIAELGAELRAGRSNDEASLNAAFAGAYGAFYIQRSSDDSSAEARAAIVRAVAHAAKHAGLQHVIWATLEDPGQALLDHDDLTPTFIEGRWVADEARRHDAEEIFAELGVPTTFLQTSWDPSVAAGQWTEDIGRYAYTLFRGVESIGKTVAISALRLVRGIPSFPVESALPPPPAAKASPSPSRSPPPRARVSSSPATASARRPLFALARPEVETGRQLRARRIGIAVAILAGTVLGLALARQIVRPEGQQRRQRITGSVVGIAAPPLPPPPPPVVTAIEAAAAIEAMAAPAPPPSAPAENPRLAADVDPATGTHSIARRLLAVKSVRHAAPHRPGAVAAPVATPAAVRVPLTPSAPAALGKSAAIAPAVAPTPAAASRAAAPGVTARAPDAVAALAGAPPSPGYIDPRAVSAAVRAHASEARACYDRAIMEHPDLRGRLTVHATIDPGGRVLSLTPASTIVEGGRLQACLLAAFKSWTFPAPTGGANGSIKYAFSFESE